MARALAVRGRDIAGEYERVIDYYRERLAKRPSLPKWEYEPVYIGPTWQRTKNGYWLLPERTLGWESLGWTGVWLQHSRDEPWRFTDEQARFWLWWFSLEPDGSFTYRDGVLQRLKGWGKDPMGAAWLGTELVGPCRFLEWWHGEEPVATDMPGAWVQTCAVSLEQTRNTMRLFPSLFSSSAIDEFHLQIGIEMVYGLKGDRFLQAHTSSPKTMEGNRITAVLGNETHLWFKANEGHEMAAVIRRNAAKAPDGASRSLRITNAYSPGKDSVAEHDRDAYEKMAAGRTLTTGILYDSIEASPDAPLSAEKAPLVVPSIKGDSYWLQESAIVKEILDTRNPPSESRRWWYNQITASEDAWLTPQQWDAGVDESLVLEPGDQLVAFFDGSKSDDATSLTAVRVSDGAAFSLGVWARPQHLAEWSVPREDVDGTVRRAFALYDVVAFFGDPGAGEDETGQRYWDAIMDGWSRDFGGDEPGPEGLCIWAVASGPDRHAVTWDMRSAARQRLFTEACERTLADIAEGALKHGGQEAAADEAVVRRLRQLEREHALNARRRPNAWGISIGKESRMSGKKIDNAVTLIGARMLWRLYQGLPEDKKRQLPKPSPYESHGLRRLGV